MIAHLRETIANALDSLAGIEAGERSYENGEDVTSWWVAKYNQLIAISTDLIRGYEKHND